VIHIFEAISKKFQFKFKDRVYAANILGESLKDRVKKEDEQRNAVILGIPRGGVITADIIAKKLSTTNFDIIIPRKLTDPDNKEQSIGAIMEDGTAYIDQELINDLQISSEYLEKEKLEQIQEIKRKTSLYRKEKDNHNGPLLKDKTVILVDDGAASGATLIVAAKWIKKLHQQQQQNKPKRLIIAIPVAPKSTVNLLKEECDGAEVEVVTSPSSTFHSVGQYYQNFKPVEDEQVIKIMQERNLLSYDS
jgi:putative phosphoribosyl transferase